jgi:hypothetical protein
MLTGHDNVLLCVALQGAMDRMTPLGRIAIEYPEYALLIADVDRGLINASTVAMKVQTLQASRLMRAYQQQRNQARRNFFNSIWRPVENLFQNIGRYLQANLMLNAITTFTTVVVTVGVFFMVLPRRPNQLLPGGTPPLIGNGSQGSGGDITPPKERTRMIPNRSRNRQVTVDIEEIEEIEEPTQPTASLQRNAERRQPVGVNREEVLPSQTSADNN